MVAPRLVFYSSYLEQVRISRFTVLVKQVKSRCYSLQAPAFLLSHLSITVKFLDRLAECTVAETYGTHQLTNSLNSGKNTAFQVSGNWKQTSHGPMQHMFQVPPVRFYLVLAQILLCDLIRSFCYLMMRLYR